MPRLITSLLDSSAYPHAVDRVRLIETHISWVLLAGAYAYKIKKPVDLGFLDFSTLARRRHYCAEEVRLNRRLAPDTYLGVVRVTDRAGATAIGGNGRAREWAVQMRAFPPDATLDREVRVTCGQIDAIAERIATFHDQVLAAPAKGRFGTPPAVMAPIRENFRQIRDTLRRNTLSDPLRTSCDDRLSAIESWSEDAFTRLAGLLRQRREAGRVRECHGDLHLGNIAWVNERPLIFDCIEFNPGLRFIDVISEIAFLWMDLAHRGLAGLAARFLNHYLEFTGDYDGLAVLRFYAVYRALVRAKVSGLRVNQGDGTAAAALAGYIALADRLRRHAGPALMLMHGPSGAGKSTLAEAVIEASGAIRLRSDVERKRLYGLSPRQDSGGIAGGIYTAEATDRTFTRLREITDRLLAGGFRVIVDATFLAHHLRAPFIKLARRQGIPVRILSVDGPEDLLRQRVMARATQGSDASEAGLAVLDNQLRHREPLDSAERPLESRFDGADPATWPAAIATLLRELRANA